MFKKLLVVLCIMMISSTAYASTNMVVTLGNDLNQEQRAQMLRQFAVEEGKVDIITVTIAEEREYLQDVVPAEKIGIRSLSSAKVQKKSEGEGITVETYNIDWVTKEMYANALVTAGVRDAQITVASPVKVSGTAALTGIMKAFEQLEGKTITDEAKKTANEEMVKTGELGDQIGDKKKAAQLVKEVKEEIIDRRVTEIEEIKRIIADISIKLDINITETQKEELAQVMKKITNLNLNVDVIKNQVTQLGDTVKEISQNTEKAKGFFASLMEAIMNIFRKIAEIFS